jgi:hypothetical protein
MAEAVYTTREAVMASPDIKASAYAGPRIDDAIAAGADAVDKLCHLGSRSRGIPGFAPWAGTLTFDWPNDQDARSGELWLNQHKLLSLTSMTSGGTSIPIGVAGALLEPSASGPPYNSVRLDRGGASYFSAGTGVGQRSLSLTGVWAGAADNERSSSTLSAAVNGSVELVSTGADVGVGSIIRVDDERMIVVGRNWASSGATGSLAANTQAQTLAVADGTIFRAGEELLIDAERVLIRDIAGNNIFVQRAWAGSTLAAHTTATVYWPRSLIVERGQLGTTAAAHSSGATVHVWQPPALIATLNRAYAIDTFLQESSGYARTIGSQETEREFNGRGIRALEERVYGAYGRRPRTRAV